MATLQETFKYAGNASTSALNNINIHFKIPTFEFITVLKDGRPDPRRNVHGEQLMISNKKLNDTSYSIAFPNEFLSGHTANSLKNFHSYLNHIGFTNNDQRLLDSLSAEISVDINDEKGNLFGQIQMRSLYSLSTASDKYKDITDRQAALHSGVYDVASEKLELELTDYIRKNIFIINKNLFAEAAIQFKLAEPRFNEYALLFIISHVTDVSSGKPKIKIIIDEFKSFLKTHFEIGSTESIKTLLKIIKDELFDFPVSVPEITAVEIKGTFKIITPGNSAVAINDFNFFDLTVEYTVQAPGGNTHPVATSFDWVAIQQATNNTVPFSFAPVITNLINSSINVRVKAYDGSVVWENQYAVTNTDLQKLKIEVPLSKPIVVTGDNEPKASGGNKKLTGKVVELSGVCKLKGITIVIQAKTATATIWKIVGSATTDSSGNFSLPYPYGNYVAAQALVSLMPNSPADIPVYNDVAHVAINETIADDFLYLLLKDVDCPPEEEGEANCDCKSIKKSNRLPDQEELIKSDSYTQDIGGSCVNLSIPNRTLNEYSQRAVVRTSDPDVANYKLTKDAMGNFVLEGGLTKIVRKPVDLNNPIYWQDAPDDHNNLSLYQAVTVATGHILHYKIVTKADGYSMGELLYSLPLAPGQKKEIVIFEQTHTLTGSEVQRLSQQESLAASLVNETDITDTIAGNLAEATRGTSSATTAGVSGGLGLAGIIYGVAGTLGVAGGVANAHSTASQNSSRSLSEYFHEQMKNAINQNAQSYREMNASVITTVQEGQRYGLTTEVVANHNHCHSLTMMYFEVLRHYAIYQELSHVEECLFVPLLMTDFTRENVFKWRDVLAKHLLPMPSETYLQPFAVVKSGRQHPLLRGFDAIDRIKTNYANVDYPAGAYDEEIINFITGEIYIQTNLPRPKSKYDRIKSWPLEKKSTWSWSGALIGGVLGGPLGALVGGYLNSDGTVKTEAYAKIDEYISVDANFASVPPAQCIRIIKIDEYFFEESGFDRAQWTAYANLLGTDVFGMLSYYFKDRLISEWDSIYYNDIAPLVFEKIYKSIGLSTKTISNNNNTIKFAGIDLSAENKYKGGNVIAKINLRSNGSNIKRNQIETLTIEFNNFAGLTTDLATLTVRNVNIRYSTSHYNGVLCGVYVGDDLVDNTEIYTPENANEKRNPRKEDEYIAQKLIEHLNSNLAHYNKWLWQELDKDSLYMLLDGFSIGTYDDFGQPIGYRSLASVVKNELIGISGNSLIMPVTPGYKIDRTFIVEQPIEGPATEIDLFEHYKPLTPIPPYRISIPSKGVFAEAVQGACDACEKVKENTSQDWDKFKTDEPTAINPVTVPVPAVTDWKAAFKEFAAPLVNIQNAPAAPAPGAGLAAAGISDLLGKSDVFKDITGLDQNQKNAMQTYLSNQENAKAFGEMAKEIFIMGHNTEHSDKIADSIRNSPELSKEEKAKLLKDHFGQMVDGGQTKKADQEKESSKPTLTDAAIKAADEGKTVKATSADGSGKAESVEIGTGSTGTTGSGAGASDDPTDLAPIFESWPFTEGSSSAVPSLPDFDVSGETTDMLVFNSPEHFGVGEGLQDLVDAWARAGLISGGAFVEDSDNRGLPIPLSAWKIYTPDRAHPAKPYGDFPVFARAHWHWIVPNAHRDENMQFWTPNSLRAAIKVGKAVTLSIGDIVMVGGDLVGEFAEFANAATSAWRHGPVNIAKGIANSEPFAMTGARLMQFPSSGLDQLDDMRLLERNMNDYAGLKAEISANGPAWNAIQAVVAFLCKARGPSGCSELLVLSRMMRKEAISLNLLSQVSPWVTQADQDTMNAAVRAAGFTEMTRRNFNSDLFQFIVSNGYYAQLAMDNTVHFTPHNWAKFEATHTQALQKVEAQVPVSSVSIEYGPIPADAVAQTAFSLHFLSDAFSSGHMRTPRQALGRAGSLLSGIMHDFDNRLGLTVENGFAQKWRAFGDGYLVNLNPAQRKLLEGMSQVVSGRSDANKDAVISAMGSAMIQLHYQAQKHFGDTANAAEFQTVLGAARGTSDRLLYDDAVFGATPGQPGDGRDTWVALDIPAKIAFLRKHQPVPVTDGANWRSGNVNHTPLVTVDGAGNPVVLGTDGYRWAQHWSKLNEDRTLIFNGERDFQVDMTSYLLMAANTPDAALSWLGDQEVWLPAAMKIWPEDTTE